jgi:dienelactone hydrolase
MHRLIFSLAAAVAAWLALPLASISAQEAGLAAALSAEKAANWRTQIGQALYVPEELPPLAAEAHGKFEPEPGVVAERVSYQTQFGLRVPAILYLPKEHRGELPALIVVNGHGGDKYSWYAFYSGVLYARAGAAVLTYDPLGEGERNVERKSGTRAHDRVLAPTEMGRRLGGLMVTDVRQAVSYLCSRPEIDSRRIGAMGYSMGSFILALAGATDNRLKACVLAGGGNLDGPGEYWDKSKPMCQGLPYQALGFLGDRAAAIYALHALRGPTLIFNGAADTVVAIPTHGEPFFHDLKRRTTALLGKTDGVFDYRFMDGISHRPFFVTRDVALWLDEQLDFPAWSQADIEKMPATHISEWAAANNVAMDRLYNVEDREGGTPALGANMPALTRQQLSVFTADQWQQRKGRFLYESWVANARQAVAASKARMEQTAAARLKSLAARDFQRRTIYHSPQSPGYTCWVGAWQMPEKSLPGKSLMVTFKQATGPLAGRERSTELLKRIGTELKDPQRDFTGLELANVYLRSTDGGATWKVTAEDAFPGPFDRASWGGSHVGLADGSILRATDGSQLPLVADLPRRIFFERSADLGKTWQRLPLPPEPRRPTDDYLGDFGDCVSRVRRLRDGCLLATGVIRPSAVRSGAGEPLIMLSGDEGRSWQPQPIDLPPAARQPRAWNEWDWAELPGGHLLAVFRRNDPENRTKQVRWQGVLRRQDDGWKLTDYAPAPFDHSGHPELLSTREGAVLHIATTGIHWTSDAGQHWQPLDFAGQKQPYRARYYPRSLQTDDGRIFIFSHVGSDNAYGQVDQAIVMDTFRLDMTSGDMQ